ncbi:hypothetical protein VTL71DRAFT_12994 [Oculimacula yallundae]|uniref:Uncharacterized protein n=1 Tax=Oculimacula yallundae TaxID=86028 RepID=A0ABR4CPK6_9HELO
MSFDVANAMYRAWHEQHKPSQHNSAPSNLASLPAHHSHSMPSASFDSSKIIPQPSPGQPLPQSFSAPTTLPAPQIAGMTAASIYTNSQVPHHGYQQQIQQPYTPPATRPGSQISGMAVPPTYAHGMMPQQGFQQQIPQVYTTPASTPAPQNAGMNGSSLDTTGMMPQHGYHPAIRPQTFTPPVSTPAFQNPSMAVAPLNVNGMLPQAGSQQGFQQQIPQMYTPPATRPASQNSGMAVSMDTNNQASQQVHGQMGLQPYHPPNPLPTPESNVLSIPTTIISHEDQSKHLWYWIEVIKPLTFHESHLSQSEASRLATLYLSKLDQTTIHPNAHASTTLTLLSESSSFLRYQVLGVLFPLMRRWTSTSDFRTLLSRSTRIQRLALWRQKTIDEPQSMNSYLEVLDTMLDRRWTYAVDAGGNEGVKSMRYKMQGYLLAKFVLTADLVFVELMLKFNTEPYNRERWLNVHYPAMLLKLMAVNQDPVMLPFLVSPPYWPATSRVDEGVMQRCVALLGQKLD